MPALFAFLHHVAAVAAGVVLVAGLLRVFFFEKGAAYYFHSAPFLAKLSLFLIIALLSIRPPSNSSPGGSPSAKDRFRR